MKRKKSIYWLLQIEKTKNIRFCEKYQNIKALEFNKNKKIIDKLSGWDIEKICWIGDEALDNPKFIELLKYAKSKGIQCELLFNYSCDIESEVFKEASEYIDAVTFSADSIDDKVNEKLGKGKEYFQHLFWNLVFLQHIKGKVNVLTMANNLNVRKYGEIREYISKTGIDTWKTIEYMPILLNKITDIDELYVSKINFKLYFDHLSVWDRRIEHLYTYHKFDISKNINIILPNGDLSAIGYDDSILIGNILTDDKERIEKNFNNRKIKIIPRKKDEKIRILISNEDEKAINEIKRQLSKFEYVDIIETCKTGKETYEKIMKLRPEMAFIQYEYKDLQNKNIIVDLRKNLELEFPIIILSFKEYNQQVHHKAFKESDGKLNCWNCNNDFYEDEFIDMIKEYKKYRDGR